MSVIRAGSIAPFWVMIVCLLTGVGAGARGAEAVFSRDEKSVYLLAPEGLLQLDLAGKSVQKIAFPTKFEADKDYGVSLSNAGYLLLAANDGVWAYDPARAKWAAVYH